MAHVALVASHSPCAFHAAHVAASSASSQRVVHACATNPHSRRNCAGAFAVDDRQVVALRDRVGAVARRGEDAEAVRKLLVVGVVRAVRVGGRAVVEQVDDWRRDAPKVVAVGAEDAARELQHDAHHVPRVAHAPPHARVGVARVGGDEERVHAAQRLGVEVEGLVLMGEERLAKLGASARGSASVRR